MEVIEETLTNQDPQEIYLMDARGGVKSLVLSNHDWKFNANSSDVMSHVYTWTNFLVLEKIFHGK